ncbi:Protein N-lysine methyltransferase METTL21A [Vitis vinifera]|uniref:Protein N-lysine methyltransferase METTL21A n=1 Tax=Vitis vinifera TaxID=29760 RepID=A0A438ITV3_VITVI|nr:Protein N-lysine methyltransferase METTL21A [Vitis vinifera]
MGIREISISGHKLTIHELEDVCDSATGRVLTGSWLWDSSLLLSQWMATRAEDIRGKSVIELGAGTGLPGLTAAMLGAGRVVLDGRGGAAAGLERNVEVNGLGERVEVREVVWGSEEEGEFDIVWCGSEVRQWTYECLGQLVSEGFGVVELPSPVGVSDGSWDLFSIFHLIPPIEGCHVGEYLVLEGPGDA